MSSLWIVWDGYSEKVVRVVDECLQSDNHSEYERHNPRNDSECFGNIGCNSHFGLPTKHHPKVKQRSIEVGHENSADDLQCEGREECGDGEQRVVEEH